MEEGYEYYQDDADDDEYEDDEGYYLVGDNDEDNVGPFDLRGIADVRCVPES